MKTDKYCNQVTTLLTKEAVPTTYAHLQEVKLEADNILASVADILSQQDTTTSNLPSPSTVYQLYSS